MSTAKNNSQVINDIDYNGNQLPFSVSLKAISAVEKESGVKLIDLIINYDAEKAIMMCREGIKAGFKNRKLDERCAEVTDDFVIEMIEAMPEVYGHVLKTYDTAFARLNNIQVEGN